MVPIPGAGFRVGVARPELRMLVESLDYVPERVSRGEVPAARKLLERDGAVILTDWPVEPDSAVNAASAMLGTRLRELEKLQLKTTENTAGTHDGPSPGLLHRDGAHVVADIDGHVVHVRIPDPDYLVIFCAVPAPSGGESVVVDGYRLIERISAGAPELYEFLTTVDVDVTSRNANPDIQRIPRVCRMLEWTRGGRMIVRNAELAQPMPRESHWNEHERLIQTYVDVLATLTAHLREDTTLAAGEALVVDNYRCLHGVRDHRGTRTSYVLRCKSKDAR